MTEPPAPERAAGQVRQRTALEVRWRQFRNAPRPIVRAVASSLVTAVLLGILYLPYDVAISRGAQLPGGDLRLGFLALDVLAVLTVGTIVTYVVVPQPTGAGTERRRSPWSAALGFFAAVPVAYLVLVVVLQILLPLVR